MVEYKVGTKAYDHLSYVHTNKMFNETQKHEEEDVRDIAIYYSTTGFRITKTSLLIDLPTFISNIGGNLGLFLGFSCLGTLFYVIDYLAKCSIS